MSAVTPGMLEVLGVAGATAAVEAEALRRRGEMRWRGYVADALFALCAALGNPPRSRYRDVPPRAEQIDGLSVAVERLRGMGVGIKNGKWQMGNGK